MKAIGEKIITIFFLFTTLGVVSCGGDGDNNSELPLPTPTEFKNERTSVGDV